LDRKELLKRWALAYTEPSLFYIPWKGKGKEKLYGEYVLVKFDAHWKIFQSWQKAPVFAVYRIGVSNEEELVYSTAVYDDSQHVVRMSLASNCFAVASKHGCAGYNPNNSYFHNETYKMLLTSGNYKIRMLCSGSGMVTNNISEWNFTVELNGDNQTYLYDYNTYCYRFRTVEINPFIGYTYLGITSEIKEAGKLEYDARLKDTSKRTMSIDENVIIEYNSAHQPIDATPFSEIIKEDIYTTYYIGEFCINEYLGIVKGSYQSDDIQLLNERGRKQIVSNSAIEPQSTYEKWYIKDTSSLCFYTSPTSEYNPSYNFTFSIGNQIDGSNYASIDDFYGGTNIFNGNPNTNYVDTVGIKSYESYTEYDVSSVSQAGIRLSTNQWYISNHDANSLSMQLKTITLQSGGVLESSYAFYKPETIPNNQISLTREENTLNRRYSECLKITDEYKKMYAQNFTNRYKYKSDRMIWYSQGVPFSYFLTNINPLPQSSKMIQKSKLTTEITNNVLTFSEDIDEEIVFYDTCPTIIDLGTDWSGYDNYQDDTAWNSTFLYSTKCEVYHPELIPKESTE